MSDLHDLDRVAVSVDGASFALVDGAWAHVPPSATTSHADSPVPDGCISIGGAWFRSIDGELRPVTAPVPAPAAPGRTIPAGYVSVDGALLPVEPSVRGLDAGPPTEAPEPRSVPTDGASALSPTR